VAYGLKLPPSFLSAPKLGCLNLHPSLLPKYRGAAPINWSLINGEERTGITVIRMNDRMDAGDIVLQDGVEIRPGENAGSLESRLAELGSGLMLRALADVASGRAGAASQDESLATAAPKLGPEDCRIDWRRSGRDIVNLVRGLTPKPGAYAMFRGKRLEVAGAREAGPDGAEAAGAGPGNLVGVDPGLGPLVMASDGPLALVLVKPEGKRLMSGGEFARGYRPEAGERLE
jgi:methionyl-tRNA formyltransferase